MKLDSIKRRKVWECKSDICLNWTLNGNCLEDHWPKCNRNKGLKTGRKGAVLKLLCSDLPKTVLIRKDIDLNEDMSNFTLKHKLK